MSIGLPVYNGERFLGEAIESILRQDYSDLELIIGDNGSTDGTADICRRYAEQDRRIRYHPSARNRGAAWNYSRLFRLSSGVYFKWASHDDVLAPGYLRRCVETLDAAPSSVVLCYPQTRSIDESGNRLKDYSDRLELRSRHPHARLRQLLRNLSGCNPVFGVIRSQALASTGLIQPFNGSDVTLLVELSLRGEFWEVPEPLFLRRVHPGMSGRANRTGRETRQWFDPSFRGAFAVKESRVYGECFMAVARSPLDTVSKARCLSVLSTTGSRKYWRGIGADCRLILFHTLKRLARRQQEAPQAAHAPDRRAEAA